jgi:hypothetical protein
MQSDRHEETEKLPKDETELVFLHKHELLQHAKSQGILL